MNLAAALAALNERVLLVDLDPQGNATMGSGIDKGALAASSYHWLVSEQDFTRVFQTSPAHFDVMPSNIDLTAADQARPPLRRCWGGWTSWLLVELGQIRR